MARPLRVEFPGAYYHVMNRGLERRRTFLNEADHQSFLSLFEDISRRWQVKIFAYCCMPNHYHLLLQTPLGNLSRVMRHLDGLYTQRFNRRHRRDGPLFRGRYKAILVGADTYLLQVVRYIHLNPVAAGIVEQPSRYPWSSHRLYRFRKPPDWLASVEVLEQFADPEAFERFVAEGNSLSLAAFYDRRRWSPFLGDEGFIAQTLAAARPTREHPRAQRTPQFPDIQTVVRHICLKTGSDPQSVLRGGSGRRNLPRSLAIYAASRIAGFSHPEIRRFFGLGSDGAVTRASQRTADLIAEDPKLRLIIAEALAGGSPRGMC